MTDWEQKAACRPGQGVESELFFPIGTGDAALMQIEEAKQVCRQCPAMQSCLEWAMATRQEHGIWGSLSEGERRNLERRRRRGTAVA